ncbi:uncharacterized protein EV420DRAFT_1558415 [Desarmillaria tabescens]|uniref:MYND-type domain-containing protein n=1 Tax=Armillaria tabescens TaxID=1929756 RepID=A0AA39K1U2_ARMTA|nr:uncharacterized protein EV420DRAFT_1558415 [Desarmillaria tabescens]KAK0452772.1 hypothetical protein EV420DRAFT_1558415 [Desarmillaria tabescens]
MGPPRLIRFPNGTSFALDAAIDLFVESLSDPIRPSHCLRASRHDLLKTSLTFLTAPRSQDEVHALQSAMETCSCPKDNPLSNGLHKYCPSIKHRPGRRSAGKHRCGQVTPNEFYSTFGAETAVKMLWQWAYMYQLQPSFLLFSSVIVMAGTTLSVMIFIMPSFAPQLIEIINKDVDSLEKIGSLADRDFTVLQQAETIALITTTEMIAKGEGRRVNTYWQNHKEALLQALSRVVSITTGAPFHEELLKRVCIIHDALSVPHDPAKYHPLILEGSRALREEHKKENDFWRAYRAIRQATVSDRCYSPGCLETFTSMGRKFQFCSGCVRVPYCSRQCQRQAWKTGQAPHRIICQMVKSFSDWIELQYKFKIEDYLEPDVVERMCREKGVEENDAYAIDRYFDVLDKLLIIKNPYDSRVGEGH